MTGRYHVYERGVPDIVLQHEKCIGHSVKVPGKRPLSGMDISPWMYHNFRKQDGSVQTVLKIKPSSVTHC